MSRLTFVGSELWGTRRLFAVLCEIIHLSLQRVKGNYTRCCWAKSNSSISQRRNWERVFTLNANGAFKQSGNHSLLHRYHQQSCCSYTLCHFQRLQREVAWISETLASVQSFRASSVLSWIEASLYSTLISFTDIYFDTWMEIVQACEGQLLYGRMAPLVQRKVISSGPARKENLLTMSPWPLSLSPPPSVSATPSPFSLSRTGSRVYDVKLFPEDPVELIVGEALTLNCTALVEFNAGVDIRWSYPRKQVHSSNSWSHIQWHQ